jgi:predicted DNA-binding ribbon-helix-helix protein
MDGVQPAPPSDDSVDLPPDALAGMADPEFRTVPVNGMRKGIRLEKIFWDSLTDIGNKLGMRRATLVRTVLEEPGRDGGNAASLLRCYVAQSLTTDIASLRRLAEPDHAIRLLQQAPIPSFAINRQKKLLQVNPEFMQFLRIVSGSVAGNISAEIAQISLETPVEQLFERIRLPTDSAQTQMTVRMDSRQRRVTAKIVAVPPGPPTILVGYILA